MEAAEAETPAVNVVAERATAVAGTVAEVEAAAKAGGTEAFPRASPTTAEPTVREPTRVGERTPVAAARAAYPVIVRWAHVAAVAAGGSVDVAVAGAATAAVAAEP